MTFRRVMVTLPEQDIHDQLPDSDILVNDVGKRYILEGQTAGILSNYATLAAAMADQANQTVGQYVMIAGGQDVGAKPGDDEGVWKLTAATAARADYTKVLDGTNKASEVYVDDTAGFYASTDVEGALAEIGTKQVFYKLGNTTLTATVAGTTSTAVNAALAALVIDNGSQTDAIGAGSSSVPGILLDATFSYQIPLRNHATRDVISDGGNNEVYARLSYAAGSYVLSFFSFIAGVETAFTMPSTAIDLGYVLVSQDFMKLPAYAGVVQGEFFGDQAGTVGTTADTQVTTSGPFTGLLSGKTTQSAVNAEIDLLGLATAGNGASLVKVQSGGNFAATDVQGALNELFSDLGSKVTSYATLAAAAAAGGKVIGDYVIITALTISGDPQERGIWEVTANTGSSTGDYTQVLDISHTAAEVLIANAYSHFAGTQVEAALEELFSAIGGTNTTTRSYTSQQFILANDSLVVAIGKLDAAIAALTSTRLVSHDFTANEAINAATSGPQLVAQDGTPFYVNLAVAGATGPKVEIVGFATGGNYVANGAITGGGDPHEGLVFAGLLGGFSGLTPGHTYYANPAVPGGITDLVPSTVGQWIIPVGVAASATVLTVRVGEPNEIVPAQPPLQRGVHFKSTSGVVGGLGETGYAVAVGDIWIDNDVSVQNPTKSAVGRYTVYVCKVAWTGAGAALNAGNVNANFQAIGRQN